mmetsp:Transcript_13383/g.27437  ORF Transcript_13383/g.27437 Transcript_13383/m.27437 type:complete len:295 (+) Transcript_13383:114-998(+)
MTSSSIIISDAEEMNPSKRNTMEDIHRVVRNFGSSEEKLYLGVYDGHGGRGIVDFMEQRLEQNIIKEMETLTADQNVPPATGFPTGAPTGAAAAAPQSPNQTTTSQGKQHSSTLAAMERAYLLTDIQSRQAGIMASGATAVSCLLDLKLRKIYAANCGDARAVLGRGGRALRLTHDHKADDPEEIGRIESAGGFVLRNRVLGILAVARSFGDHGMKEFVISRPHLTEHDLQDGDEFVVVGCDGLWDVISDEECCGLVRKYAEEGGDKEEVARRLVDESLARGSTDNISVVVAFL